MTDFETLSKIEEHISAISSLLGIPVTDSNCDTPHRVAKMYCNELFKNRNDLNLESLREIMKVFEAPKHAGPVTIEDIEFWSVCEHHWLPFGGTCSVLYVPDKCIIGLSKIPRVVKYYSQRPQLQEKLTNDIGRFLCEIIQPRYLKVEMVAKHTCVMCRGAESNCQTRTVYEYNASYDYGRTRHLASAGRSATET